MDKHSDMTSDIRAKVDRNLWQLAIPPIIQGFMFTAVYFVDTLMISRTGAAQTAAMAVSGIVMWCVSFSIFAFSRATIALVSQATGAGNHNEARQAAGHSILLAFFAGVLGALGMYFLTPVGIKPFGIDDNAKTLAVIYLQIVGAALIFAVPSHILSVIFQSSGNTKLPFLVSIVGNTVNIVGDYVLIFGKFGFPEMGLAGAAVATSLCRVTEFTLMGVFLLRGELCPRFSDVFHIDWTLMRRIRIIAVPAHIEAACFHGGFIIFSGIMSWLGTTAMAAHQLCMSIEALAFMPGEGFGVAAATHVGQSIGGKKMKEAAYGMATLKFRMVILMGAIAFAFFFFSSTIMSVFSAPPEVHRLASLALMMSSAELIPLGIALLCIGALRGAGDTKNPLKATVVGIWLIRIPLTALVVLKLSWGIVGVWTVCAIEWTCRSFMLQKALRKTLAKFPDE
jgi:putative MATE family efflux protein